MEQCRCLYRFRGLSRPEGSFFKFGRSVQLLTLVWLVICGINMPLFVLTDTAVMWNRSTATTIVYCARLQFMTPKSQQIYSLVGRILVFLVPLIITWVSYVGIYWRTMRASSKVMLFHIRYSFLSIPYLLK
jgi:hypothetical protein